MENNFSELTIYLMVLVGIAIMFCLALALVIFFNRTQRRKLEQKELELVKERQLTVRLQQIDRLKDQFLANTSHELRTPLQGILGISEFLYEDAEVIGPAELRENLSVAISSGRRLNSLINDLLDFSKLKNFDLELHNRPVHLKILVDIVMRNNAPLARGKNLQLHNELPEDMPVVFGDEDRLQQVFYNLIGNAIKFTEEGHIKVGSLPVGATYTGGGEKSEEGAHPGSSEDEISAIESVVVFVEDTGIGIPEDKREQIFLEFEQADGSISREFTGTGLGLSISRRLVELHGGEMWVESEVGRGSRFYLRLPVANGVEVSRSSDHLGSPAGLTVSRLTASDVGRFAYHPETERPRDRDAEYRPDAGKINILVVDDEPINQTVLSNHLARENYRLTQAMNGEQALMAIERDTSYDLVILDVMMPRMSGYEVCERIRQKYLPSELPVIMVTAKNQVQDLVQGLSQGANDYLAKPFSREEFLARVKTQLDLHRINEVTSKFVPNEFLKSLGRDRITEVILGDHIEREVTVLFADIRGYTALSESMTPEENFQFVNSVIGRMGSLIPNYGGFVNQYLGDAIMGIFPDSPEGALRAAIAMQEAIRRYNEGQATSVRVGIGFHLGPLIMGIIGDRKRMDAATVADTVNVASRLESLTKYYGANILLSDECLSKIPDAQRFDLRYLGQVILKGKQKALGIYECFGGDEPALQERKRATLETFQRAITAFFQREFVEAADAFQRVLAVGPEDRVAELFLQKTEQLLQDGAPPDWTGIEKLNWK